MFNKTYHVRAKRQGLGQLVAEGLLSREALPHRSSKAGRNFKRPGPGFKPLQGKQLELFPPEPLADLFGDDVLEEIK